VNGRDFLILGAVLLVGGFAVADSLRSEEAPERREARTTGTERSTTVSREQSRLGREKLPDVPGAGGSLVFTDAETCAVREFDLPSGQEFPNLVRSSSCELWAAPVTYKVAVGVGPPARDAVPFRFLDLTHPRRNLGGSRAYFGRLVWSADGQRAAWCTRPGVGFDVELGRGANRLRDCPAAYTPAGEIAYARGDSVVVGERVVQRASGGVTYVRFGTDGSLAVIVDGRRVERYVDGRLRGEAELHGALEGRIPILSPDNCAALVRTGSRMRLLDLGCSRVPDRSTLFPGTSAAWSPDGRWLAVAGTDEIAFYELARNGREIYWPVGASQVAWRR
jgi:hypothetical protein